MMRFLCEFLTNLFSSKTIITHDDLHKLIDRGVINAKHENVNTTSIDITMHNMILIESFNPDKQPINISKGDMILVREHVMNHAGYALSPNEFILGSSIEVFNLPDNISAEYKLKSSMARLGLEHFNAGWIDAGFHGRLTLELKNMTQFNTLTINEGDKCGQIVFFRHKTVPWYASYAIKGRYNGHTKATRSKGII